MGVKFNPFSGKLQWYNTSAGAAGDSISLEQFTGSDASGASGDNNRVITTANVSNATGEIMVFVDTQFLRKTDDYSVSGDDVTIVSKLFDSQQVDIQYMTGTVSVSLEQFTGASATGTSGDTSRVLTTTGASGASGEVTIYLDGQHLRKTDDYSIVGNDITFAVKLFDSQEIDVVYI